MSRTMSPTPSLSEIQRGAPPRKVDVADAVILSVRVPTGMRTRLAQVARSSGYSESDLIRAALTLLLEKLEAE